MTKEIFYRPHKALCADKKIRTARVRSYWAEGRWHMYGDTYFSVPAYIRVAGKYIAGYVCGIEDYDKPSPIYPIEFNAHGRWRGLAPGL